MNFQTAPIEPSTKKSQSDFPNDFFMYKAVDGSSVHEFRNENLKNLSETVEQLFNPKKLDESMFDCTATDDELAEYK